METYTVIGITGEHYKVRAENWSINHDWGTIRFVVGNTCVALFEMKNIIGVISEREE